MPSIISGSLTIAPEPPVVRTERSTWMLAGLPIAIDLAIAFGLTGSATPCGVEAHQAGARSRPPGL